MQLLNQDNLQALLDKVGLQSFMQQLGTALIADYARWEDFSKVPRHATAVEHGVIELMPIADQQYYACKYVNGHPHNPEHGLATVIGLGLLAEVATGYPLLISEMTVLTAIRTAVMAATVARYAADSAASCLAIIGCGAQSEFQVLAHLAYFKLEKIYYYDIDPKAMHKFANNLRSYGVECVAAENIADCVRTADIVVTATTVHGKGPSLAINDLQKHVHINAIGGDCPGKNELTKSLLEQAEQVIVELPAQTQHEGEIEQFDASQQARVLPFYKLAQAGLPPASNIAAELPSMHDCHGLAQQLTIFDSVGFALEDYSTLVLVHKLLQQHTAAEDCALIPKLKDPKDLFSAISQVRW